jgi:hypothetical protein
MPSTVSGNELIVLGYISIILALDLLLGALGHKQEFMEKWSLGTGDVKKSSARDRRNV